MTKLNMRHMQGAYQGKEECRTGTPYTEYFRTPRRDDKYRPANLLHVQLIEAPKTVRSTPAAQNHAGPHAT